MPKQKCSYLFFTSVATKCIESFPWNFSNNTYKVTDIHVYVVNIYLIKFLIRSSLHEILYTGLNTVRFGPERMKFTCM